jgi:DNA-directed RNA polymerase subunit N (RpoN/RPB10)
MKKLYLSAVIFFSSSCFGQQQFNYGALYNQCMSGGNMANVNPSVYQQNPAEYCQSVVAYEFDQLTNLVNNPPPCTQNIIDNIGIQRNCQQGRISISDCRIAEEKANSCFTSYPLLKYLISN